MNTETKHHYFASFVFGWKTAETRDEAVKGLVEGFRSDIKGMVSRAHKTGDLGAYIWSVKVEAPIDTHYGINFFKPEGVDISDGKHHFVTYVTNKKIAYHTEDK